MLYNANAVICRCTRWHNCCETEKYERQEIKWAVKQTTLLCLCTSYVCMFDCIKHCHPPPAWHPFLSETVVYSASVCPSFSCRGPSRPLGADWCPLTCLSFFASPVHSNPDTQTQLWFKLWCNGAVVPQINQVIKEIRLRIWPPVWMSLGKILNL